MSQSCLEGGSSDAAFLLSVLQQLVQTNYAVLITAKSLAVEAILDIYGYWIGHATSVGVNADIDC